MPLPSVDPSLIYRTPDSAFSNLPSFPYTPHYAHYGNLRYAYLDLFPSTIYDLKTGTEVTYDVPHEQIRVETVLALHGEPTWSYLYRKMIPGFLNAVAKRTDVPDKQRYIRRRVVIPDFIGFGRSDKPINDDYYTFDSHRDWLVTFVRRHLIDDPRTAPGSKVTLVVQDWGGILGLLLPSLFPALFTHLLIMNTGLGLGRPPTPGWLAFRDFIARSPDVDVGALISRGTPILSAAEVDAYRAPFVGLGSDGGKKSEIRAKAGVRRFPQLVPVHPSMRGVPDSHAALSYFTSLPPHGGMYTDNSLSKSAHAASRTPLNVFVVVGEADPVLGLEVMDKLARKAFGRVGYHWHVIKEAGHFVQEWASHIPSLAEHVWAREPSERAQGGRGGGGGGAGTGRGGGAELLDQVEWRQGSGSGSGGSKL